MPNLSLLSLPAFYMMSLYPHLYANNLLYNARAYNNVSPRSASVVANNAKALGPRMFARYERAKAAHTNGLESFPLFIAAILAGTVVGLSDSEMNLVAALILGSRMAYNWLYISVEGGALHWARTGVWLGHLLICWWVLVQAGLKSM